jgi:hypothetical protein
VNQNKQEILKVVSAWLDSASDPEGADRELLLRKHAVVRSGSQTVGVNIVIEARTAVGQVTLPVNTSSIVAPTPEDVARVKPT